MENAFQVLSEELPKVKAKVIAVNSTTFGDKTIATFKAGLGRWLCTIDHDIEAEAKQYPTRVPLLSVSDDGNILTKSEGKDIIITPSVNIETSAEGTEVTFTMSMVGQSCTTKQGETVSKDEEETAEATN